MSVQCACAADWSTSAKGVLDSLNIAPVFELEGFKLLSRPRHAYAWLILRIPRTENRFHVTIKEDEASGVLVSVDGRFAGAHSTRPCRSCDGGRPAALFRASVTADGETELSLVNMALYDGASSLPAIAGHVVTNRAVAMDALAHLSWLEDEQEALSA